MRIEVKFSRLGCLWNFVETLTLYHFSYNEKVVQDWLSWTGGELSPLEKETLTELSSVASRLNQGQKGVKGSSWRLDQAFLTKEDAWREVSSIANSEEVEVIKNAIKVLEPRFNKIWPDEEERLRARQQVLEGGFNGAQAARIIKVLRTFFQPDNEPEKVEIFLLLNTEPNSTQGGANLGAGQITLHCSHSEPVTYERFAGIIWHEITHLFLQEHYFKLENAYSSGIQKPAFWDPRTPTGDSIIREAVVASLAHDGYIDEKFLGLDLEKHWAGDFGAEWRNPPTTFNSWQNYASYHLQAQVERYVNEKRPIDEDFIKEFLKIWSEYQQAAFTQLKN